MGAHTGASAVLGRGVSLGDPGTEGLTVLFWSLPRLNSKSLERASMDYEAPLMPCGCILLPGGWSAHGKVQLRKAAQRAQLRGAGKETGDPESWQGEGRDRGSKSPSFLV